jgi:small nuclear ribonucleoprotein
MGRMMHRPLDTLRKNIGKRVIVTLRQGREYRGLLDGYDPHMNIVLKQSEEYIDGSKVGSANIQIIRGDNVVYISPP